MARPVPQIAIDAAKRLERCVLRVYDDARPDLILHAGYRPAGRLTAGYGHTGPDVIIDMAVTQDLADHWLVADLGRAAIRLSRVVEPEVIASLSDHQYSALVLFVMNAGVPGHTLWDDLNARKFEAVPDALRMFKYAKVDGVETEIEGLVNRREAEIALWGGN